MLNIVKYKNFYLIFSAILVGVAVWAIFTFHFREGIDFSGGTLWEFKISQNTPSVSEIQSVFGNTLKIADVRLNYDVQNNTFLSRFGSATEADHQQFLQLLKNKYPSFEERSFQSIGPSIGKDLRQKAITAIILVLVGISLYIAFAFRKTSRPVSSWKYGWITLITLFHDVIIPAGLIAFLGKYVQVEIDSNFVVALLVVMGFSVHDTIVVFDRIRENLSLHRGKMEFSAIVNESVNQTLARSINTSLTLILVLIALYITGPLGLRYFILTLLVGVTTGIYSSIFVASPTLLLVNRNIKK